LKGKKVTDVKLEEENRKIVMAGLENSGKTSLIYVFSGATNLLSYTAIKPTPGVKIHKLEPNKNMNLNIWELGGQEIYRKKYFEKNLLPDYFEFTSKFMYVIDVQDKGRYQDSFTYLKQLMEYFDPLPELEIVVFLHKFDPAITNEKGYDRKTIETELINPIISIIPKKFKVEIYQSTIFTIFQKSRCY
jgi:GTPase SAR1 family protein